ncbi:hypothetical protein LTR67_008709 [Exophiala xenobiotica]
MSQGIHKRPQETHQTSKAKQHTGKIIAQLDERIHHLQEHIVPRQPYLVSVPSDVPYRHSSRFTNTWYEGTPFDRHEEQLQYLSFLAHQGDHESLLKVEGGWADEQGNPIEEELSPRTVPASGRNTPAEPGHRKRISLKDYKTKSKSPPTTHLRPHSLALENKVKDVGINPVVRTQETAKAPQLNTDKEEPPPKVDVRVSDCKSEAPLSNGPVSAANPRKDQAEEGSSPAKKQKLLPPSEDSRSVAKSPKVESQQPSMKLPTLLSPTLPSPEDENRLPQLLSPVLPPSLAKAMSSSPNPTSLGSPVIGLHQRTESVRSILAGADLDNDPSNDRSKLAPAGSRVRSDSTPNAVRTILGSKVLSKNGSKVGTPLQNGARASPGPRQRHTIILKYGKKNRKRVEALLKFAPRPKKEVVKQEASNTPEIRPKKELIKQEDRDGQRTPDVKVKLSALDDVKLEKKRKAEDSPRLAVKKMKSSNLTAEDVKRPSTPVPPASRTPLMSQSRPTFTTPKKELKSTAMRRVESSDGIDVPTPTGDKGRVSTPVSAPKPSPQPTSLSSREEERQQWSTMNTKFFTLGRSLKHEGTSMLPASDDDSKPAQSAKAVILIIEALLCFMINIAAQGHARPSVDPGWRSIILYHIFVWRASRKYPHLHGLVVQLGAVCRQYVQKYELEKLARDPLPEDYCNSAPTPSSDGNTRPSEDVEKYKKRYIQFRDDMIHNIHELQTAWLDGFRQLSPELLRREYPNTWGKRAKDASARMQEKPSPSKIARDFYLPMDANTTPFEAARFGLAFLEEWAEKEKIEWKTKMDF